VRNLAGKPHQVIIKSLFKAFGIYPAQAKKYEQLIADRERLYHLNSQLEFFKKLPEEKIAFFTKNLSRSYYQFFQDLFVAAELGAKKGGFFVEIGACDGIKLSNSLFLRGTWVGVEFSQNPEKHGTRTLERIEYPKLTRVQFGATRVANCYLTKLN